MQRLLGPTEAPLQCTEAITLSHPETTLWTELWRMEVSPIFHVETAGIPVILHQEGSRWYPTWHPWPGEEVRLAVTRPAGVEGQTITIDKSSLETRPGQRASDTRGITFQEVAVPAENRVGGEGRGWFLAMKAFEHTRPVVAAAAVGGAAGEHHGAGGAGESRPCAIGRLGRVGTQEEPCRPVNRRAGGTAMPVH